MELRESMGCNSTAQTVVLEVKLDNGARREHRRMSEATSEVGYWCNNIS